MKWQQRTAEELDPSLIEKYQLSPIAAKLFALRGIDSDEKLDFWFNATEENLADPSLMHDMDRPLIESIKQLIMVKRLRFMATMMLTGSLRQRL